MRFKVKVLLDTGHEDDDFEGESPNGHYATREFATEVEARAFIAGCDLASEATNNWLDGSVDARLVEKPDA